MNLAKGTKDLYTANYKKNNCWRKINKWRDSLYLWTGTLNIATRPIRPKVTYGFNAFLLSLLFIHFTETETHRKAHPKIHMESQETLSDRNTREQEQSGSTQVSGSGRRTCEGGEVGVWPARSPRERSREPGSDCRIGGRLVSDTGAKAVQRGRPVFSHDWYQETQQEMKRNSSLTQHTKVNPKLSKDLPVPES